MPDLPAEAARAVFLCAVGARFGCPPHEVGRWPASTMRTLELDATVTKYLRERQSEG